MSDGTGFALVLMWLIGWPIAAWLLVPLARREAMVSPGAAALFFGIMWPLVGWMLAVMWAGGKAGRWLEEKRP